MSICGNLFVQDANSEKTAVQNKSKQFKIAIYYVFF